MNFYFALPARRADFRSAVSRRCFFYVFALLGALSFFTASARAQSSYQLNTVFVNKGSAGLSAVQGDVTIQKTTTPAHKSNNVETREYDGYFQAWSNSSKLALLSDDGTTVTIDGVRVLDKAGRGQGFDEPNAQTFDTLNASFQIGRIYHIHLSYSNTIHRNDADVDGLTLFAYDGGGTTEPVKVSLSTNKTAISAGGWSQNNGYNYWNIEAGASTLRQAKPDPHIATLTATVTDMDGNALADREVKFTWDMPGPVDEKTAYATSDSSGRAAVDVISGDELSKATDASGNIVYDVPVEVKAEVSSVEATTKLDVVRPQDNWSPIEVSPDQDGDPTVRITLTQGGLPVNGHPIEWSIDKITDEDGQDVPADQYSDYVSISGRISTTNKDGMAAAYLHFGLKSGTVYYSARDGVVYRPASEAGTQTVASSGIAASSSTGSAAGSQSTATARGRQWYNHLNLYAVRGVVTTHEVHPSPVQVLQSTTKRLVVIHSIFSFRYDPVKNGQRISGLVRMQVKSDLYGNDPLDIIVPLDGKSHVRSTFRGRRLCLTPGQSAYYSEFARTLLSELWTARQPDQQIKTLSLVAEGYGAASWDFIDTAWKLNPVVLPFTIYNNRAAIGDGFTKAFSLTINGAKFVLTDPKALNILQRSPIEMPAAIVATYGSDSNFRQKTFAIARRASSMMAKGFDDLIIDAANNPDKFKRNSGYAGGTVSIFAMTWYSAETEVIGTKVASKLLATMPIKTATTILRFTKAADVLVNETNLTPILGKILSKNRPVLAATGGLTVRATTDEIVGSVGSGWSSKMNVQLTPVETTAEVGAQQTNNQVMRNVARLQPNQPAAVKFQELIPGKPNSDFIGHIIRGEGIKSGEVSGAHNMQEFLKYLSSPKGTMIRIIRAEHHPTIRGIIRFEYQVARVDSGGNLIGGFKTAVSKTVYDPKFISDGEYARWICEARQESLLHPSSTVGRLWYGEAKNGLYMKGYLNQQGNVKTGWAWF